MKAFKIAVVVALLCAIPIGLIAWVGWDNLLGFFSEPTADISSPKRFEEGELALSYPSNWSVESDKSISDGVEVRTHQFESAGSAMVIVQMFQPAVHVSLDEYVKNFVSGFDQKLSSNWAGMLKSQGVQQREMKRRLLGEERDGKQIKLNLRALNEKVPFTIEIISAVSEDTTVIVTSMVPDEDVDAAQPGIDLVRRTMTLASNN